MADNDQPSRLEAATIRAEVGSDIVYRVANLPADQTVATDSGNIPTLAGVLEYVQNEGDTAAADVRAKADAQVQAAIGTLVKKAGDTMTGALVLSGNPTQALQASPKQFVDSGDAATLTSSKTYTDQAIAAIPKPFSKYFESSPMTIASGGLASSPHNLGVRPKFCGAILVVTTAQAGYSVGDTIELTSHSVLLGSAEPIMDMYYDSVRVYAQFAAGNPAIRLLTKNGGGATTNATITSGFNIIIRAFI